MQISCPHCHATYEVGPLIRNAVLVCYRCHTEFRTDDKPLTEKREQQESDQTLPLLEHTPTRQEIESSTETDISTDTEIPELETSELEISNPEIPDSEKTEPEESTQKRVIEEENVQSPELPEREQQQVEESDYEKIVPALEAVEESGDFTAPQTEREPLTPPDIEPQPTRKPLAIWPWLITILLIISAVGFWYKQDAWLDNPWLRSLLINMQLPIEARNSDWLILPESVQGNWLKRDDGSQVLVIQGRIKNRLYSDLPPPRILVKFFDDTSLTESLGESIMAITEPPSMEQVKHAPFITPKIDHLTIEAQSGRGFFLVMESLPERTADFTLTPITDRM